MKLLALFALLFLSGCDQQDPPTNPKVLKLAPGHKFISLTTAWNSGQYFLTTRDPDGNYIVSVLAYDLTPTSLAYAPTRIEETK